MAVSTAGAKTTAILLSYLLIFIDGYCLTQYFTHDKTFNLHNRGHRLWLVFNLLIIMTEMELIRYIGKHMTKGKHLWYGMTSSKHFAHMTPTLIISIAFISIAVIGFMMITNRTHPLRHHFVAMISMVLLANVGTFGLNHIAQHRYRTVLMKNHAIKLHIVKKRYVTNNQTNQSS